MRSPVSRAAAAVIFILAVGGVALWFHGAGATPALAEFVKAILDAKSVKYKSTVEMTSLPSGIVGTSGLSSDEQRELMKPKVSVVMELGSHRSRHESGEGKSHMVEIWDGNLGKQLVLYPDEKRAMVIDFSKRPGQKAPPGSDRDSHVPRDPGSPPSVALFRRLLSDTRNIPDVQQESLGEKLLDGRRVVGFRISHEGTVMSVWGDPRTRLPVRVETTSALMPNVKVTMTDFVFNVEMDESLFSVQPPAGYKVTVQQHKTKDRSPTGETDLIAMFRYYCQWTGGRLPDLLDFEWLNHVVWSAEWLQANLERDKPEEKRSEQLAEARTTLSRGVTFALTLPKEADWHYAGRGVSLGAADRPIFWYRPKGSKAYRIIDADLSVHEARTPPRVAAVPAAEREKDLIEMLRQHTALDDGYFPHALDTTDVLAAVEERGYLDPKAPGKPSVHEKPDTAKALVTLVRGLTFIDLLTKEADWHYAGKGVSIGAAEKPIFWYRPKDAKTFRVIYGDFSVREAAAPPAAPVEPPEQDLINALRYYSRLFGGALPGSLGNPQVTGVQGVAAVEIIAVDKILLQSALEGAKVPNAAQMKEVKKAERTMMPGLLFVGLLPPDADAHYAGRGVMLGTANRPIFWYRPKGATKYRVLFADLSVRDADMPPAAPVAPPEQDLLDALRYYCELSGGRFPAGLIGPLGVQLAGDDFEPSGGRAPEARDDENLTQLFEKKFGPLNEKKPIAKQMQTALEMQMNLIPGAQFAAMLPPEADAHYAGRGISLGAADRPIFWYRPKDRKKYRVVYADLSVREADHAPKVPNAQPVDVQPKAKK